SVLLLNWDKSAGEVQIKHLPDLPLALTAGALTHYKDKLYFLGGQNDSLVSNQLFCLDLEAREREWKALPHLPYQVTHTVLYGRARDSVPYLYCVGGRKRNPDAPSTLYKKVYRFNIKEEKWTALASLPYAL